MCARLLRPGKLDSQFIFQQLYMNIACGRKTINFFIIHLILPSSPDVFFLDCACARMRNPENSLVHESNNVCSCYLIGYSFHACVRMTVILCTKGQGIGSFTGEF